MENKYADFMFANGWRIFLAVLILAVSAKAVMAYLGIKILFGFVLP